MAHFKAKSKGVPMGTAVGENFLLLGVIWTIVFVNIRNNALVLEIRPHAWPQWCSHREYYYTALTTIT